MEKRRYNSPLRGKRKAETIQQILDAAVRLHRQGITDFPSVAREAGISLATVTKYFPTREELFQGCTAHFASRLPPISPEAWAGIPGGPERVERVLADILSIYEVGFGQIWVAYRLAEESRVMEGMLQTIHGVCHTAAQVIAGDSIPPERRAERIAVIAGLLSPLTYRSLRLVSGLSPEEASQWLARVILAALECEEGSR
ncbi:MAG: TetR/AcrR family transcriptional regulator [Bacillota bacterium]